VDEVHRAQARDRDAFEMLVEQHSSAIFRLAAAIVGDAGAADVAQEAFVVAWQQLPRLRHPDAFDSWLRRICVNRARNWLRTENRRGAVTSLDATEPSLAGGGDFRGQVEARVLLEPAFVRLTPDQRAVLALHYSMGYSIADSANALGIRVGTAKSRLNAGLRALRRAVDSHDEQAEPEAAS
jgi:RNA polymerase sigma-70 factor, ECF subfamily